MTAIVRAPLRMRLTLDDGLASYLRALVNGVGLYGDERETAIYLIRDGLIDRFKADGFRAAMMPHLPDDIRRAWGDRP
jgi:hypothetical protein